MSVRAQVDSAAASAAAAVSADAIAALRVALRAVTALPLDLAKATAGLLVADELRAVFQESVDACAASAPVRGPGAKRLRLDHAPLTLLQLPPDVVLLLFCRLDLRSLVCIATTCSRLYHEDPPRPMTLAEEALRERAVVRGYVSPVCLPEGGATSWVPYLAWLERRRDEAWAPVAAGVSGRQSATVCSFFVAEGGRLMRCGAIGAIANATITAISTTAAAGIAEDDKDGDTFMLPTPTLLPSMAGIRISCVSAGYGFVAAVSVAGRVYTWGDGDQGQLGHGDTENNLVPKQVHALTGHQILSVATGFSHCMAVTTRGAVFSWGWDADGQCGHGRSSVDGRSRDENEMLPRLVDALHGVRVRSASVGISHSLVVTEEGALYSFGAGWEGQLGHGTFDQTGYPVLVDALRHVRIVATAAGDYHSLGLTEDGVVFSWGDNLSCHGDAVSGKLGLGQMGKPQKVALPHKVEALRGRNVCTVVASGDASCAVTTAGELFTWGCGARGRLGHGDEDVQLAPKRVDVLRDEWVVSVTLGSHNGIAVVRDGGVFGWGYGDGLGLQEAAAAMPNDGNNVFSPCRYQQLVCMP